MISGKFPYTIWNRIVAGRPGLSKIVRYHVYFIRFAFSQRKPLPWSYMATGGEASDLYVLIDRSRLLRIFLPLRSVICTTVLDLCMSRFCSVLRPTHLPKNRLFSLFLCGWWFFIALLFIFVILVNRFWVIFWFSCLTSEFCFLRCFVLSLFSFPTIFVILLHLSRALLATSCNMPVSPTPIATYIGLRVLSVTFS